MTLDQIIAAVHGLLMNHLPAHHARTPSGWTTMNCPMCDDRRRRGGLISDGPRISFNCFNCGFKASWSPGYGLNKKFKILAETLGADSREIGQVQLSLIKYSNDLSVMKADDHSFVSVDRFPEIPVPEYTDVQDLPDDHEIKQYAQQRGLLGLYPLWHIDSVVNRRRLVVPFFFQNTLVGWTGRHVCPPDKKTPKYLHHQIPRGYVFNIDKFYNSPRNMVIVTEGVFDAILIDGVSVLGNTMTSEQQHLITSLRMKTILCPDRDQAGVMLQNQAAELGWYVSFPPWESHIKDAAEAVNHYGRIPTVSSIIAHAENNKIKIKLRGQIHERHRQLHG